MKICSLWQLINFLPRLQNFFLVFCTMVCPKPSNFQTFYEQNATCDRNVKTFCWELVMPKQPSNNTAKITPEHVNVNGTTELVQVFGPHRKVILQSSVFCASSWGGPDGLFAAAHGTLTRAALRAVGCAFAVSTVTSTAFARSSCLMKQSQWKRTTARRISELRFFFHKMNAPFRRPFFRESFRFSLRETVPQLIHVRVFVHRNETISNR